MVPDADIVVVGGGIVGAATARALTRTSERVILVERFELGHARGSSHGTSRIFRLNYPDERYVRLARAAAEAWRELEDESGEVLIERTGSLDIGATDRTSRALGTSGVPFETLDAAGVSARWPIHLEEGETAVFQADGGTTHASRAHRALVTLAKAGGVEIREREPVHHLELESRGVRLTLDSGVLRARAVVVAAGAWAPALLSDVGVELPVVPTRETVVYLDVPGADTLPPVIDYERTPGSTTPGIARAGQAAYALAAPAEGLKAGLHHSGPVSDPDDAAAADEHVAAWVAEWAESRFETVGSVRNAETCLYANTADEGFVLERHGRVVVGSACSGHGFKFAPVVGRTLAALAREAAH